MYDASYHTIPFFLPPLRWPCSRDLSFFLFEGDGPPKLALYKVYLHDSELESRKSQNLLIELMMISLNFFTIDPFLALYILYTFTTINKHSFLNPHTLSRFLKLESSNKMYVCTCRLHCIDREVYITYVKQRDRRFKCHTICWGYCVENIYLLYIYIYDVHLYTLYNSTSICLFHLTQPTSIVWRTMKSNM